jgi:hypothetical protein
MQFFNRDEGIIWLPAITFVDFGKLLALIFFYTKIVSFLGLVFFFIVDGCTKKIKILNQERTIMYGVVLIGFV